MTVAYHSAQIPADGVVLEADIVVPQQARGMVLFAHGSGSSRFSPRNRYVAGQLQHAGLATVLADLLTPAEEQADARTGQMRFDIGLLAATANGAGRLARRPGSYRRPGLGALRRQHRCRGRARRRSGPPCPGARGRLPRRPP